MKISTLYKAGISKVESLYDFYRTGCSMPKKACLSISSLRGNSSSRICVIAPPLSQEEYVRGLPLTSKDACCFHNILAEEAGFDTNEDCFVVSSSVFGIKANKASTSAMRDYVARLAEENLVDLFVCVGDLSFKFIFGRGKMPPMTALQGSLIHHADIDHRPVFTFPSLVGLVEDLSDPAVAGDYRKSRAVKDWAEKSQIKFRTLALKFKTVLPK